MTTTRKYPRSASATAHVISRILRQDGFQRISRHDFEKGGEGYYVYVTDSKTVAVDYHIPGIKFATDNDEGKRMERRSKIAQMRETLFELGYISTHPRQIYIKCQTL